MSSSDEQTRFKISRFQRGHVIDEQSSVSESPFHRRRDTHWTTDVQEGHERSPRAHLGVERNVAKFATVTADHALARAERADAETARGMNLGPLHGVPITVKDLCDTAFAQTAAGTILRRDLMPIADATVVEQLELGGALILGKLAMTEGAYTSHYPDNPGPTNP